MTGPKASENVVGIDIGATKTHVALGRNDELIAEQVVPTSSWRSVSSVINAGELVDLVDQVAHGQARGLPFGVGAHGCDSTQQCLDFEEALAALVDGPVRVLNDAELMPLAMGFHGSIGIVSGTGSIGVARDSEGRLVTAGGWGRILGDEGGASGIVRESVRAVLGSIDRGEPVDPLQARLMACFHSSDGPELAMAFTRQNSAAAWGGYASEVFAAAAEGSLIASTVIEGAADELASLVKRLLARGIVTRHVVAGGGVIQTEVGLRDRFIASLAIDCPEMSVTVLDRAPVIGALALASSLEKTEGM
jgi:N-acetylglucosamine kinase-like BadF-type ATPase